MTMLGPFLIVLLCGQTYAQPDPLPSWNDGSAKTAIVEFVKTTTEKNSPKFVPAEARIAVFDQDGTLWVEHPMYSQVVYCLDRVPAVVEGEAGSREDRAVQDCPVRQPRSDGEVHNAAVGNDSCRYSHRHDGG